jgi:hypothetical protein
MAAATTRISEFESQSESGGVGRSSAHSEPERCRSDRHLHASQMDAGLPHRLG